MSSFTTRIKDEVTKIETNKLESIAELHSYLYFNSNLINNNIYLYIENASVARRMFMLIKRLYNINIYLTIRTQKKFHKKTIYILEIKDKVDFIINDYMSTRKNILSYSDEEKSSYLKGAFLGSGSINDPSTSKYHLEIFVKDKDDAELINKLFKYFYINSKILKRTKLYMVYVKSSEEISDFIKLIGATSSLFYYEDIRIYRDHKNMVNRLNNCEQANVEKSMKTASIQLDNIKYLEEHDLIDLLDDKTKIIVTYRKKYPDVSMSELASIISLETDYKITKSGINHHFRKIKQMIESHDANNGKQK